MHHFDLNNKPAFDQWVDYKKASYELRQAENFPVLIDIDANGDIPQSALATIRDHIHRYNFALYRLQGDPVNGHLDCVKNIGAQMGLKELDQNLCAMEDRVTKLTVVDNGQNSRYIPYSNKAISWHNDGYYNPHHQRVLAMVLHCEQPAASGGENDLLDQDIVYIHLRQHNPDFIKALSNPQVMCIPENVENGKVIRPQTCSAVFMQENSQLDRQQSKAGDVTSELAMRYTQRKFNIIWAQDALTQEALHCLDEFLNTPSAYHVHYRLKQGEGVICNNVLHTRSAFTDSAESKRVYYRARYYNRISL